MTELITVLFLDSLRIFRLHGAVQHLRHGKNMARARTIPSRSPAKPTASDTQ